MFSRAFNFEKKLAFLSIVSILNEVRKIFLVIKAGTTTPYTGKVKK